MKRKLLKILILILLTKAIFANIESNIPNEIKQLRYNLTPSNIRVVIEFTRAHDYQFDIFQKPYGIEVGLFNTKIQEKVRACYFFKDPLLEQIILTRLNIRQLNLKINLKYEVPKENVFFTLRDPNKLVIDIKRSYFKKSQFQVTPNILWTQKKIASFWGYLLINELKINIKNENVELKVALADDSSADDSENKLKKLSEIASQNNALIAINGGFFSREKGSSGLVIIDGDIKNPPFSSRPPRTAFGITREKEIKISRVKEESEKILSLDGKIWDNVIYGLGGGPTLIKSGHIYLTTLLEKFGKNGNDITKKAGRTILGIFKNGQLILATFGGYKDNHSQGIKLENLARYLLQLQVKDAFNLDGGGSIGMWLKNKLVSLPPGGGKFERKIANAVLIYDKSQFLMPDKIKIISEKNNILADGKEKINIVVEVLNEAEQKVKDGTEVNLVTSIGNIKPHTACTKDGFANFAFISQRKTGKAVIKATSGLAEDYIEIYLEPGKPSKIFTELEKIEQEKYLLKVLITDDFLNPLELEKVNFEVVAENNEDIDKVKIESNNLTDKTGTCEAFITLPDNSKAKILITSGELKKEIIVEENS